MTSRADEITPKELYISRRRFLKNAALVSGSVALGLSFAPDLFRRKRCQPANAYSCEKKLLQHGGKQNSFKDITKYNNFKRLTRS